MAMVVHEVGVDDDVMEVRIRSHSRSEDGEEKISQGEQNVDIQEGGEDEEGNSFLKMEAYVPSETWYSQSRTIDEVVLHYWKSLITYKFYVKLKWQW